MKYKKGDKVLVENGRTNVSITLIGQRGEVVQEPVYENFVSVEIKNIVYGLDENELKLLERKSQVG